MRTTSMIHSNASTSGPIHQGRRVCRLRLNVMAMQDQRVISTLDHVDKLLRFPDVDPYRKY